MTFAAACSACAREFLFYDAKVSGVIRPANSDRTAMTIEPFAAPEHWGIIGGGFLGMTIAVRLARWPSR